MESDPKLQSTEPTARDKPLTSDLGSTQHNVASAKPIVLLLLVWVAIVLFSCWRYQPVEVVSADAPADVFSAERAEVFFKRLYKNAEPHPAGENEAFRKKVVAEFEKLGYRVQQDKYFSSVYSQRTNARKVGLVNLLTSTDTLQDSAKTVQGKDQPLLMLTAHFDSHPAGPGASDDGVGLSALLEIARMLKDGPHEGLPTVAFLITDGEEYGLLGAKKFVEYSPLASGNTIVINLEARGTTGPSLMFETSNESWWLINHYANAVRKPATSSLFYEVYRFLPNSSDFTEFRNCGMRGFNFAFIGEVKNYHTPNDNFETADRRSLQHHGDNAWRLIQRLRRPDLELPTEGRAVYFDFYNLFVVRWFAGLSLPLSLFALLTIWLGSRRLLRFELPEKGKWPSWFSFVLPLLVLVDLLILGKLIEVAFRFDGVFDSAVLDHPVPVQATFWCWAITLAAAGSAWIVNKVSWEKVWQSQMALWIAMAIAMSIWLSGGSYLFIVPLLLTACGLVLSARLPVHRRAIFVAASFAVSIGILWLPMERLFYDALGFRMMIPLIVRVALVSSTLIPLMLLVKRESLWRLSLVLTLVSGGVTMWSVLAN